MVRRRLSDAERASAAGTPDAGHTLTDVVGTLVRRDVSTLVVEPRRGPHVEIAVSDVVAAKEIPPSPSRRDHPHRAISTSDLQEVMNDGWLAEEGHWLGRWLLRASGGYTKRANSCLTLGAPPGPVEQALDSVRAWYAERNQPALLQVPLPAGVRASDDDLVRFARSCGWQATSPTLVMTASTAYVLESAAREPRATVELSTGITPTWWHLVDDRTREHESVARALLTRSPEQIFATAFDGGNPVAHARMASAQGWGGLFDITTAPEQRRRGFARSVVEACASVARKRDALSLYLQVSAANEGAIELYDRLGFTTHHTYVYLEAPSQDALQPERSEGSDGPQRERHEPVRRHEVTFDDR